VHVHEIIIIVYSIKAQRAKVYTSILVLETAAALAFALAYNNQAFRGRKLQNGGRFRWDVVGTDIIFTMCPRAPKDPWS